MELKMIGKPIDSEIMLDVKGDKKEQNIQNLEQ